MKCPNSGFTHIWSYEEIKYFIWPHLLWSMAQMAGKSAKIHKITVSGEPKHNQGSTREIRAYKLFL